MSGIGESSLHSEYHLRPYSVVKDRHATPMMRVACDELSVENTRRRSKENVEGRGYVGNVIVRHLGLHN